MLNTQLFFLKPHTESAMGMCESFAAERAETEAKTSHVIFVSCPINNSNHPFLMDARHSRVSLSLKDSNYTIYFQNKING